MYYKELAEKVRYFKEDEKGMANMCKALEEMRNEVAQEVARKAEEQTKTKSVLRWIAKGLSFEDIAEGEDLSIEQVREIAGMKKA